jgi:hypothetical protein
MNRAMQGEADLALPRVGAVELTKARLVLHTAEAALAEASL